ncbi:MAG: septal ring lytic transglycosylase RlpA family protein [Bacteroidetes bacterium]|nr:septal ring lytic transglycosylase RlpA family protein [Bacteroidota bacterium]
MRWLLLAVAVLPLFSLPGCGSGSPRFASDADHSDEPELGSYQLEGIASYYADDFHGRRTANGEVYDMHGITAAHRTLPFNSILRVTNLKNGKTVTVRINDRGPFVGGRIVDLSLGAAKKIDMLNDGTAPVRIEILELGQSGK